MVVADANGDTVTAAKTVIVTEGGQIGGGSNALDVRYDVNPRSGSVPFNAQFTAFVTGGKEPYSYAWDFDGDGTFDSFIKNPLWTFESIGQEVLPGTHIVVPTLQVTDSRGVTSTNLDDKDGDGNPDFKLVITANPFVSLFIGLLITALIQSSSTTTSMIVAMVASGAIEMQQSGREKPNVLG